MIPTSSIADALAAYRQNGAAGPTSASPAAAEETAGVESFGDMMKTFAGDTVHALKEGESAALASASGKADLTSVITAIGKAELMLQTVVTIRDKVIAAYQDISKTSV